MKVPKRYFLDTNAVSAYLRGRDRMLVAHVEQMLSRLRLSSIVWSELEYGVRKRPDLPKLRGGLRWLRERIPDVDPYDEVAAEHTGDVRAYLAKLRPNAQPIGAMDSLLAGHALALGYGIVTANVREFTRVVEDWGER